jgi:hypothetical protein
MTFIGVVTKLQYFILFVDGRGRRRWNNQGRGYCPNARQGRPPRDTCWSRHWRSGFRVLECGWYPP